MDKNYDVNDFKNVVLKDNVYDYVSLGKFDIINYHVLKCRVCNAEFETHPELYRRRLHKSPVCTFCNPLKERKKALPFETLINKNLYDYISKTDKKLSNGMPLYLLKCKICNSKFEIDSSLYNKRKKRNVSCCTHCNPPKNRKKGSQNFEKIVNNDNFCKYVRKTNLRRFGKVVHLLCCKTCFKEFTAVSRLYNSRKKSNDIICTHCNPLNSPYSNLEQKIFDFISSIYKGNIQRNAFCVIHSYYNLDIYLSELQLAFEVNGDYWHANPKFYKENDLIGRKRLLAKDIWQKDELKRKLCQDKGIKLITIWETDWVERQNVVKRYINKIISKI